MSVVKSLRDAGVDAAQVDTRSGATMTVAVGSKTTTFAVKERTRAPYPNELGSLEPHRLAVGPSSHPVLVVPFVSEELAPALIGAGWSWADSEGNFDLRADQLLLRQRHTSKAPRRRRTSLPTGSGGLAILRSLVRIEVGAEVGTTALAAAAGVSQPRASQVVRQLHDQQLVDRTPAGRWRPDRSALIDRFLSEYRGPGGGEQHFSSLDSPGDVAGKVAESGSDQRIVASADVGPDLLLAWRRPSVLVLYTSGAVAVDDLGLVPAQGRADANVIVRAPSDHSVFPEPPLKALLGAVEVDLADPLQMIWDLEDLGGADRLEAAGRLREWLLNRP